MGFKHTITFATVLSVAAIILSTITPIIPCRTAPGVPSPVYTWAMCKVAATPQAFNASREYWGYTSEILKTHITTAAVAFAVVILASYIISSKFKKKGK
jgi:hypothetical protein